ncbi:hypothetical protein Bca4012_038580 [Brassica carinata]|uniref:Uncharacterized protein n=1 Tax=Brassica carinata TaxID=52824 RepID=A0A8X7W6U9_BRACI|nr:hypothetical protein Bca52824_006897 [Brassica carinata]
MSDGDTTTAETDGSILHLREEVDLLDLRSLLKISRNFHKKLDREHQGNVTARILGILDPNSFLAACTAHKEREDEGVERTRERAEEAYQLWSNVVDSTYLFVEPGEPTFRSSLTTSTH